MRDRIDLLPAIAGIAIAAGWVNPALLVACAFVAIVTGAGLGREVFAVLGWDRLMKVAGPLHARVPLGRASAMLQRNGWRAVFTARLIPGLRVHTTDVAGVSQMPRRTFMGGLLPATAVYVAAFVGLDARRSAAQFCESSTKPSTSSWYSSLALRSGPFWWSGRAPWRGVRWPRPEAGPAF